AKARGVRVRGVQVHGSAVDKALAGQRTAANLAGIEVQDAPRGAALVQAGTLQSVGAAQVLDIELELLPWAARPLRNRARLLAHIGTAQVPCVVALVDRAELAPGERAVGQLRLGRPTAAIAGLRFLLRGELPKGSDASPATRLTKAARAHASTLGGGRILAVAARKRRRRESDAAALQALAGEDPLAQAERLLLESGYPGASPQRLAARGAFTVKSAEKTLERLGQTGKALLYDREARLYVHKEVLEALDGKVLARLHEHAARDSIDPSIAREELRQRAGSPPPKLFAKALASLADRGELRADAERVHPPGTAAKLSGPDADAQEKLAGVLEKAGLSPPRVDELPALIGQTPHRTSSLLKALAGAGRASKVSEGLWFGATALMDLRRRVLAHLSERGSIDAQSFKELTGLTRKFAIPLLEYFDREKLTLRIGDKRVLRKGER
ncbi:MAG TPA: SelB C-terminal domain-containing protein, partial [Myxococcales bacterium]|nr:SelB C-terminal domain-containing protein [Myxococcales bacterium]